MRSVIQRKGSGTASTMGPAALAKSVSLELLKLEITRKSNKGWDVYFLIEVDHPTAPGKKISMTFPEHPIDLSRRDDNEYRFGQGMEVYSGALPTDHHVGVRIYAVQAKDGARSVGRVLRQITEFIDSEVAPKAAGAAASNPYVAGGIVVNKAVNVVGKLMAKTKDKDRGFASLDERFDASELLSGATVVRRMPFTGGDIAVHYRWRIQK